MIISLTGNIFKSSAQALVCPCNCVGVMGAGLAKKFKEMFPGMFLEYAKFCDNGKLKIGHLSVHYTWAEFPTVFDDQPRIIINFPTKVHWKENSKMIYIVKGLATLKKIILEEGITSIAIPALGCGKGHLSWSVANKVIKNWADVPELDHVEIYLYGPNQST